MQLDTFGLVSFGTVVPVTAFFTVVYYDQYPLKCMLSLGLNRGAFVSASSYNLQVSDFISIFLHASSPANSSLKLS